MFLRLYIAICHTSSKVSTDDWDDVWKDELHLSQVALWKMQLIVTSPSDDDDEEEDAMSISKNRSVGKSGKGRVEEDYVQRGDRFFLWNSSSSN